MWNRILGTWQRLTSSLWFIPTLIVLAAAALAVALVEAQALVNREALGRFPRIFGADADSSRSMLAAIAGSMITVAGVTFSITVVAVSQASSQYTPRILRNFMRDRTSQVVLGVFVGIFVYCLVVVRTIRGEGELLFIPSLAVIGAYLLAIVGIGFLVYFIHHIAGTLEAGTILARVGAETADAVARLFPEGLGQSLPDIEPAELPDTWFPVAAAATGYLQRVDGDGLVRFAKRHGTVVRMERGIGGFVVEGRELASLGIDPSDDIVTELNQLYVISSYRSVHQDAEFGIRQMVDIALKALSPGVNDPSTAITSLDHIGAVLVRMAGRRVEEHYRADEGGALRVLVRGPSFDSLLGAALNEIRRHAASNVSLLGRLFSTLEVVATATGDPARRAALRRHAALVLGAAELNVRMPEDLAELRDRHRRLAESLNR